MTSLEPTTRLPVDPFDPAGALGRVRSVGPTSVGVVLALETSQNGAGRAGVSARVADLVAIDAGEAFVIGRISGIHATVVAGEPASIAEVTLLTSVDLETGEILPGIAFYPSLDAETFAADPRLVQWVTQRGDRRSEGRAVTLEIAALADGTSVSLSPERLFGRHCALVGTTGGGKSWTLARLVEASTTHAGKVILLDPTGEFHTLGDASHVSLGGADLPEACVDAVFPYRELLEADLLALFRPETNVQLARLRAAIKSLKLAEVVGMENPLVAGNGCIPKAEQPKLRFEEAYREHIDVLDSPLASFDIELLPLQMRFECVYPSAGPAPSERVRWGGPSEPDLSECDPLIGRIESNLNSPEYGCIFASSPSGDTLPSVIRNFLASDESVLRLSLRQLSFRESIREIVANAIGRHLLELGRQGAFVERPLVILVDEAHHFLNQQIGDDHWSYALDAFELIAKEGRKYALTVGLATQRPRDIPEGVLSQIGTFIVHRLINDDDRSVVERASGEIDREAAKFLPSLGPGQAVVIGVELPMPLTVQMLAPSRPPDSRGPDYQSYWR
ncbi:MAG: helicase HerA-like domain-containing protein [Gaiellaceae bacterium]